MNKHPTPWHIDPYSFRVKGTKNEFESPVDQFQIRDANEELVCCVYNVDDYDMMKKVIELVNTMGLE